MRCITLLNQGMQDYLFKSYVVVGAGLKRITRASLQLNKPIKKAGTKEMDGVQGEVSQPWYALPEALSAQGRSSAQACWNEGVTVLMEEQNRISDCVYS